MMILIFHSSLMMKKHSNDLTKQEQKTPSLKSFEIKRDHHNNKTGNT